MFLHPFVRIDIEAVDYRQCAMVASTRDYRTVWAELHTQVHASLRRCLEEAPCVGLGKLGASARHDYSLEV